MKNGVTCSYELRLIWHEESLSKGVCHGRSGVWSKNAGRPSAQHQRRVQRQASNSENETSPYKAGIYTGMARNNDPAMFLNTTIRDLKLYFEFEDQLEDEDAVELEELLDSPLHNANTALFNVHATEFPDLELSGLDIGPMALLLQPAFGSSFGGFQKLNYDSSLLSYYEAVVCSSCTLLDDADHNPYRHLFLPMAMQSEGIYHATLAVSAQILGIAEPKYRFAALDHANRALKCLIATLQRGNWSGAEIDEILGLALMLCWFEITDGCRPSWVMHLNGIHSLMTRYPQLFKRSTSALYRFFNRYFSFHVVLARTTFRVDDDLWFTNGAASNESPFAIAACAQNKNYDGITADLFPQPGNHEDYVSFSESTEFLSRTMSLNDLDQIDSYMGFSNSLLLLINEIADLAWKYPSKAEVEADLATVRSLVDRLRRSLSNLRQTPPPLCMIENSPEEANINEEDQHHLYMRTMFEFETIAEANRTGALLLLHEVCSSRFQRPDIFESDVPSSGGAKSECVRKILDIMLENINRIGRTAALPLWPLFLAGCCATSEEDRMVVMRIFEETEKPKRFGVSFFFFSF